MLVSYYCPVTVLASAALTIAISTDVVIGCCLSQVSASADNADMSGYLRQWKHRAWKRLWFVVKDNVLYTFKASEVRNVCSTTVTRVICVMKVTYIYRCHLYMFFFTKDKAKEVCFTTLQQ